MDRPRVAPSTMASQAPRPRKGAIAWAASPTNAVLPVMYRGNFGASKRP